MAHGPDLTDGRFPRGIKSETGKPRRLVCFSSLFLIWGQRNRRNHATLYLGALFSRLPLPIRAPGSNAVWWNFCSLFPGPSGIQSLPFHDSLTHVTRLSVGFTSFLPLPPDRRWLSGKESACNAGNVALIPGWAKSPGGGNGNPLSYAWLENPMDRGAWQATVWGCKRLGHNLASKQQLNNTDMNIF